MKALKVLNTIALAIPLFIAFLSLFAEELLLFAVISTMATGFIQVITGIFFWCAYPKNGYIKFYFFLVILFFTSLFFSIFNNWIWYLPPLLCFFLSVLVYSTNSKKSSFMHAEWNDLALMNYEINPELLEKYIPKGTEIDLWNGKCYLSLIGFMFENVKVLGIKVPYHVNFEEVNLRFYVKRLEDGKWKRGAVFIKEIVPKHAITIVANTLYREHYQTLNMRHSRTENNTSKTFQYEWKKDKKWNSIAVKTNKIAQAIEENSEAEFITEHYYGYTKFNENKTIEYEVRHPRWQQLEVIETLIDVDFDLIYGKDFAFLQNVKPTSTYLAIGSKITIEGKKIIK